MNINYDMMFDELHEIPTMDFQFQGTAILNVDTDLAQGINVEVWVSFKITVNTLGSMDYDKDELNGKVNEKLHNITIDDIPFINQYIIHMDYKKFEGQGRIITVNKVVNTCNITRGKTNAN